MRYLGIDYGTKKIGLALSDEGGEFAFPHSVVAYDRDFFSVLEKICKDESVEALVLGHSLTASGAENEIVEETNAFAEKLRSTLSLPVYRQNELFSSVEAHRYQTKKGDRDDSAAAIILQRFLDAKK
jgi:putative Holliday junction resolvase